MEIEIFVEILDWWDNRFMKFNLEGFSNSMYMSWGYEEFGDDCHPLLVGFGFNNEIIELCSDSAIIILFLYKVLFYMIHILFYILIFHLWFCSFIFKIILFWIIFNLYFYWIITFNEMSLNAF